MIPSLERYEEKNDPLENLGAYRAWMEFEGAETQPYVRPSSNFREHGKYLVHKIKPSSFSQLENSFMV